MTNDEYLTDCDAFGKLVESKQPSNDAMEITETIGKILEYDEDCFDYGEQIIKAVALITARDSKVRSKALNDAADRAHNHIKGMALMGGYITDDSVRSAILKDD
jgi:hypothetical protein